MLVLVFADLFVLVPVCTCGGAFTCGTFGCICSITISISVSISIFTFILLYIISYYCNMEVIVLVLQALVLQEQASGKNAEEMKECFAHL